MSTLNLIRLSQTASQIKDDLDDILSIKPPVIIGRGSLLKCPEKKLSRNHAVLDWDEDGILLKSTHQNPTYVRIKGKPKVLAQGQSTVLSHGDEFGLLLTDFWYRLDLPGQKDMEISKVDLEEKKDNLSVILNQKEDIPLQISPTTEQIEINQTNIPSDEENITKSDVTDTDFSTPSSDMNSSKSKVPIATTELSDSNGIPQTIIPTSELRKRELPQWLEKLDMGSSEQASSLAQTRPVSHGTENKDRRTNASQVSKKQLEPQNEQHIKRKCVSPVTSPVKKRKLPKKKENKYHSMSQDVDEHQSDVPISVKKNKSPNSKKKKYHSMSQDINEQGSDLPCQASPANDTHNLLESSLEKASPMKVNSRDADLKQNLHSLSDDEAEGSPVKSALDQNTPKKVGASNPNGGMAKRKSCRFGANCYRKNPLHKQHESHPGDSDYNPDSNAEESEDDRPECEFGKNCYRKNPAHKKQFKHTRQPQPRRRAKKKAKNDDEDDDSENEYDYDDPFFNDDSSDDYAPTESGSDTDFDGGTPEEDTKRMLKEAKKFVRKGK